MNMTMTEYDFINQWPTSRANQFSREALLSLYDYFEMLEQDCGINIEYDPIAFCCDYTEYESIKDACNEYDGFETVEDFEGYTTVIQVPNSEKVILQNF